MNAQNKDASTLTHAGSTSDGWGLEPGEATARIARARRAGRPRWLWPDVPTALWKASLRRLEDVATLLLADGPHGRTTRPALHARTAGEERAIAVACYTSGLGPWLGWQAERGCLAVDDRTGPVLAAHLEHGRARWVRLEVLLGEVVGVLEGAGIGALVLKGAAMARRLYGEPGLRPMADLDVMVPAARMDVAEAALAAAGFVVGGRLRKPRRSEWRPAGSATEPRSLLLVHRDDPCAVDLHASLDIDFFGVRTVAFGEPKPEDIEPVTWLPAGCGILRPPLSVAHHAVHASQGLHGLTLLRLLELVVMLRKEMRSPLDWSGLLDRLRPHGGLGFAYPAFALAARLAPEAGPRSFMEACALDAPPRLRRVVDRMRPADAQRLEGFALQERFMWGRGIGDHGRRLLYMVRPSGRSLSGLAGLYVERGWLLVRGRVRWGGADAHGAGRG